MVKRKNRLLTDAAREIWKTRNRFFSLFVLSALAVAFLSGLRTASPDMEYTADRYYDRQNLMDVQVMSTLGLTEDDLIAIEGYEGVKEVEGERSLDAVAGEEIVRVTSLPERLNLLSLQEGRLPEAPDECVTEQSLLTALELEVGDTVTIEPAEEDADALTRTEFTIVGVVNSPLYVSSDRGSSSLGSGSITALLYIPMENFTWDYYTAIYFTVEGMAALETYSDAYEDGMDDYLDAMDSFGDERATLRYDEVIGDAQQELDDAQKEYDDAKAEVEQELADGEAELADARKELDDGWAEYYDGQAELEREVADAEAELADGEQELADAYTELTDGETEYADGKQEYEDGLAEWQDGKQQYEDALAEWQDGYDEWLDGKQQYEDGLAEWEEGRQELDDGWDEYNNGLYDYEEGKKKLEDGEIKLGEGYAQLLNGRKTLDDSWAALNEQMQSQMPGSSEITADNAQTMLDGYNAQLSQAQSRLTSAQGMLEQAQAAYDGAVQALETMQPGDPGYDQAQSAVQEALSYVQAAEQGVTTAQGYVEQLSALTSGIQQLIDGEKEYEINYAIYQVSWDSLVDGRQELETAKQKLDDAKKELDDGEAELADGKIELDEAKQEIDDGWAELEAGRAELDEAKQEVDDGWAELEDARIQLEDARKELDDGWAEYEQGKVDLEEGRQELADKSAEGRQELADAYAELTDGEAEYADGLQEYEDGKQEAEDELNDAEVKLRDARQEIEDIEECEWYLLGRDSNVGLAGYSQDAERVGNLAAVFPVIFFLVAALACLTTMTRMVEEQRTQIGSLKALGFSRGAISIKYIGYAFLASLTGGLVGLAVGCTVIPLVIANAFNIMYIIPDLEFKFQPVICVVAVGAAVLCTTGASLWACLATLMATPADLMRPKAPPIGKRVFLEYIKPLWRRMSFTWKVTMRNLFRYQRRFWMTVIGIGGCTALVVTGFGLHNSIFDILDKQFDEITVYDATVGLNEDLTDGEMKEIRETLDKEPGVDSYLTSYQTSVDTVGTEHSVNGVYLFAVADPDEFNQFIELRHLEDGTSAELAEEGVIITQKLSELLDLEIGDSITLEKDDRRFSAPVTDIVENYVYHYVYLSESYYAQLFGEEVTDNVLMVRYTDDDTETADRISRELMELSGVVSYSNISTIRDAFTDSMTSIDYAVVIIIVSAAALAFVVLYNLTNINITERMRELATLKVLGFYDSETSAYVYRENIFLTLFGIALGLVLGRFLHSWMVVTVEVELVMFGRTAPPYAYVMAALLTIVFSAMVNVAAHFKLKKIDMVESLKTVE